MKKTKTGMSVWLVLNVGLALARWKINVGTLTAMGVSAGCLTMGCGYLSAAAGGVVGILAAVVFAVLAVGYAWNWWELRKRDGLLLDLREYKMARYDFDNFMSSRGANKHVTEVLWKVINDDKSYVMNLEGSKYGLKVDGRSIHIKTDMSGKRDDGGYEAFVEERMDMWGWSDSQMNEYKDKISTQLLNSGDQAQCVLMTDRSENGGYAYMHIEYNGPDEFKHLGGCDNPSYYNF